MKQFFTKRKLLAKALVLAEQSLAMVMEYTDASAQPLPKTELDALRQLMKTYHHNFISAEYIHRHQCIRAERFGDIEPIDFPVSVSARAGVRDIPVLSGKDG